MDEFCEGDLVCLKCGGPEIEVLCTVDAYPFDEGPAPAIFCLWVGQHFHIAKAFPPYALERVHRARPPYERRRYQR